MFREFHRYFPALYARLEREGNLKEMLQAEKTYGTDPAEMTLGELAIAGVGSSYLLTQVLCEEFAVKPDLALATPRARPQCGKFGGGMEKSARPDQDDPNQPDLHHSYLRRTDCRP